MKLQDRRVSILTILLRKLQKYLMEAMGSGVAVFDFDSDGLLDLYFINGADLSQAAESGHADKTAPRFWNRLYRNQGNWHFEDLTVKTNSAGREYGMGVTTTDYDADGNLDLFITNFGPDILYHNKGNGTFQDVSEEAGIYGEGWSSGATFLDYDGDGWLDLFVAGYLDWSFENNHSCGPFLPKSRSYCHPNEFGAAKHTLYRNLGNGRFADVSTATGLDSYPGKGLGVALNDLGQDGWVDLFVANDSRPQQLFLNMQGNRFEEVAISLGVAYDAEGSSYAGMGVDWIDYNRDLRTDLLVNALGRQGYWLYDNVSGRFEPVSDRSGITVLTELWSGWGIGLVDFDNDGWRDLLVGQDHVMDDIHDSDPALSTQEPLLLAHNLFGRFYDVSVRDGEIFQRNFSARAVAFGDLDNDGRIDAVINVNNASALVLKNITNAGRHLTVRLEGTLGNRDAVGSTVTISTSCGTEQRAYLGSRGSYLSSSSTDLHFGLGSEQCTEVKVCWPDGSIQSVSEPSESFIIVRQSHEP